MHDEASEKGLAFVAGTCNLNPHRQNGPYITNDSMIVASMLRNNIGLLATADQQFALVREIETANPIDI
jgi:predicted nucleic acid-binding protein